MLYSPPGIVRGQGTGMRRHSTVIGIGIAVALAAVILIASSVRRDIGGGLVRSAAESRVPPQGRPDTGVSPQSGMADTAAAAQDIDVLERAHEANPGSVRVTLRLGDAYFAAQRYDEAAATYTEALASSPGHPSATVRMAMVWHARGDDERAISLIESVIAAVPDHQEAQFDLAIVRFSRQETAAAKEAWVRAAEIDPTSRLGRASQNFVDLLSDGDGQQTTP